LAVKIVRQPNKIALIGAPTSAAAFGPGSEKAPAALRAAGLVEKLQSVGYEVTDLGDCALRMFADDEEHKRARNLPEIVAGLNDLKPRAEQAIKSGALVLVLGGDCAQVIGLITGARRYYKHINLLWFDRDADLNTPASTPSGRIDGMVLAGIIGRGSPELVRFWGEPPLVREPDAVIFGLERVDQPEQDFLTRTPMRHVYAADIRLKGATKSAQNTLTLLHSDSREFMVHLDIDVVAAEELPATNVPGNGGLSLAEVQSALSEFVSQKNLLGLDIAQYNPDKDSNGSSAKKIVDLLAQALAARLAALAPPSTPTTPVTEAAQTSAASSSSASPAHSASVTEVAGESESAKSAEASAPASTPEPATHPVDSVPPSTSSATETESAASSARTANAETATSSLGSAAPGSLSEEHPDNVPASGIQPNSETNSGTSIPESHSTTTDTD
jgi:arginase